MHWIWYVINYFSSVFNDAYVIVFFFLILGIVRSINKSTGDVFIVTPVASESLIRVNQFRLSNINLPTTFYLKGTQIPKYVCAKQDNNFNEKVIRHYKVML